MVATMRPVGWVVLVLALSATRAELLRELEISEGAPAGTRVGYIGDGNVDSGPPYLIVPVPGSAVDSDLAVDQTTGEIRTKVALDRETRASYSLVAIPLSGDNIRVLVRVLDENDNAPTFPSPVMHIEFPENTPRDVKRTLNPARDLDLGMYNTQRYNIVSGNTNNAFRLSSHRERDGVLYLDLQINGYLDRETTASYNLVIEALDGGSPPLRGSMMVNITILDVNDNPPIFNQSSYSATIPENATVGTSVLQVFATDADAGDNGQVEYSINRRQSDRNNMFKIDPVTGSITVNKPLDFETKELHELVVVARDHGLQPLETTAFVSIRVTDVNDNQPTINVIFLSDDATPKISESAQPGEFVARISVHDPDSKTEYSNVNVTLSGGDGHFGLTTRDNIIYLVIVSLPLDRESQPAYTLSVVATDTGSPPLHAARTIHLKVTDVNDNAPEFTESVYRASVAEASEAGAAVLRVTAHDADEGDNSELKYSLEGGGRAADWFAIDERTGLISTVARVDCDTEPAPTLIVVARDGGQPPLSSSATVSITVHDVNDNEPIFELSFYNVSVPENEPRGRCILKVSATDPDCGVNSMVNYTLGEGFGKLSDFDVKSDTGEICIANDLDYETRSIYEFPVIATDRGGLSTTAMVKIQLTDVNDNRPIFNPQVYNISLREGGGASSSATTPVAAVAATDQDSGKFGAITYRIVAGNDAGLFRVDRATGELFVSRPGMLSARAQPHHRLNISAHDGGGLRSTEDAEVFIDVVDSAQRPPIFEWPRYQYRVREDVKRNSVIGTVKATGTENGPRQQVRYSIYSGDPDGYFAIDFGSGAIRTAAFLDHEVKQSILLNVQATSGDPPAYGHTQVNIIIEDVNDNAPEFESSTVRISVPENVELGSPIYAAYARDRDSGQNGAVTYKLTGGSQGIFAIDPTLGHVTLLRYLDYETNPRHTLTITATDGGKPSLAANLTLLVDVQDVNDNPPVFETHEYAGKVLESAPINTQIIQVTAVDLDTGNNARLTYKLLPQQFGSKGDVFGMQPSTGWLYLTGALDRETVDSYKLTVMATDNGTPPLSATCMITVSVIDTNDNDPVFAKEAYEFSVEENLHRGALIGAVNATDLDLGENAAIRYSLIPEMASFEIHPLTGLITTKESLDREQKSSYDFVAEAKDRGTPPRSARVPVRIVVTDVNDNAPEIVDPREEVVSVREEQPPLAEVTKVRAIDRDNGDNATITYSILKGRDSDGYGVFTIDPISGVIRTKTVLDYEERNMYRLAVAATDSGKPPKQSVRVLRVEVLELNDNRPTFTSSSLVFTVRENAKIGHVVGPVIDSEHSDEENFIASSSSRHITYTLIPLTNDRESGVFDIDRSTGSLVVARQLDRETQSEYRLEVRALDTSASNNPQSSAITVKIEISDVNDNAPKWPVDPIVIQIPEDTSLGTTIYNFSATDADSGLNGEINYSLFRQYPNITEVFGVDVLTGRLTLLAPVDYETLNEYILIVKANDQATNVSERLSTAVTVRILIADSNDNTPVFVSPLPKTVIPLILSASAGTPLCHVVAVDADSGDNGRVSYVISGGNEEGHFSIGYKTGVITLAKPFTDSVHVSGKYVLNLTASDHGSPISRRAHTIVQLIPQESGENPPRFIERTYRVNVSEDLPVGSFVTRVLAKSGNAGSNLTYSIPPNVADDKFSIDPIRGVITLKGPIDRETRDSYAIPIYVTAMAARSTLSSSWGSRNGGSAISAPASFDHTVVMVRVMDVNDHAPEFRAGSCYPLSVPENSDTAIIHTVVAHDADIGANGAVTYSITAGNIGNRFSIDLASGELTARPLDRESQSRYWLLITAHDHGSPVALLGSCNISVTVEDENDNEPHFDSTRYSASVPEDAQPDTSILTVYATDADQGINARIVYSIANETTWLFRIDNRTGVITTTGAFDREWQSVYNFEVVATDGGKYEAKYQSVPVQITISDINDNKPIFTHYPFAGRVAALSQPGQSLLRVKATDADYGTNADIVYSLIGDYANSKFRINPTTGVLTASQSLASENGRLIHLEILATDKGNPPMSAIGLIELRVGDVPDGTATLNFHNSTYEVNIEENSPIGKDVLQVSAVRSDGRRQKITYSFGSGNEESIFDIDPDYGMIRVANSEKLDYEMHPGPRRRLVVVAKTESATAAYGYCTVIVNLLDRNDNAPRFTRQEYTAYIREGLPKGTAVIRLTAFDADAGANAMLRYHILDGDRDGAFAVADGSEDGGSGGAVRTHVALDREIRDAYRLTVIATDSGAPQLTGTATLIVRVLDANDNRPTFPPATTLFVSEGTEVGSVLTTVTANDVDTHPSLTYSLTGDSDFFAVDRFSAKVVLRRRMDFETRQEYIVRIRVTDTEHEAVTVVNVRVTDVNDNVPEFDQPAYFALTPEFGGRTEVEVLAVNATDADSGENGRISYHLLDGVSGVRVSESSGVVYVNSSSLPFGRRDIQMGIEAMDNGKPPRKSVAALRLQLSETTDLRPRIEQDSYRITISENTPLGKTILKLGDLNNGRDNIFSEYKIISGNEENNFDIVNPTGSLILIKSLDRELLDSFNLNLITSEVGKKSNTSAVEVHITVEDYNDNAPVFNSVDYEYKVSEGARVGETIAQILATDADFVGSPNSQVVYDITSGDDERLFKIDAHSGVLSVNRTLEYDDGIIEYNLVIRACDEGTPRLCTLNNIEITLTDENDNSPRFPVSEYFEFVGENEPIGTSVFTARATDLDKGIFGTLNYSISSSASNGYVDSDDSWKLFRIDPVSGLVTTNAVFDYEVRNRYAFALKASDVGGKTATVRVRIEIESRDEFHPQFTERSYRFAIATPNSGSLPVGYVVGRVTATDRDKGPDGRVVYYLTTQHPYFKINRTTGAIIVKKKLDGAALESGRDISLEVTAGSGRQGSLTKTIVVEISLDPLADLGTNLVAGASNDAAVSGSGGGLADWALGSLIALVLAIASFGAIFLFLHMKNRRRKKINKPGLSSDAVGGSNSYVDPSAFDTIPIRGSGADSSGAGGQFAPPKYDEIPPYGPRATASDAGAAATSELSGSEQSGSSGRGSAEDGDDGEDEEIRMINEGPLQRDSGIRGRTDDADDDDDLSDASARNTQEYLARLGIVDSGASGGATASPRRVAVSVDPMRMFDEDAADEGDIANLIYAKLDEVGGERAGGSEGSFAGEAPPPHGPSMTGSLSSIVHSEEELAGSYNWDYLLDWGPRYQPLAHVFSEIARLKDDAASARGAGGAMARDAGRAPPPLLTAVAAARARGGGGGALAAQLIALPTPPTAPRSPLHESGAAFAAAALSPSFSPSLSPLAARSPSVSPLVPPALQRARRPHPSHPTHPSHPSHPSHSRRSQRSQRSQRSAHPQHPVRDATLRL